MTTHLSTARKLLATDLKNLKYYKKSFWVYTGTHYEPKDEFEIYLLQIFQRNTELNDLAKTNSVTNVIEQLKGLARTEDKGDSSFHFYNGDVKELGDNYLTFISLKDAIYIINKDGSIHKKEHNPKFFCLSSLDFDLDPSAKCPTFTDFLNEMQPNLEDQRMLQEVTGYFLLAGFNELQIFFVFLGSGANGKSVYTKALRCLLGPKNVSSVDLSAFKDTNRFRLISTVGKLANICEDLSCTGRIAEGRLKQFVSGESMTVEEKNRPAFSFNPKAKLLFCTNTAPNFSDNSDGVYRRLVFHEWRESILDPKKQRKELCTEKFWLESGELAGIFNWALEGAQRILKREPYHIELSENAKSSTEEFKRESTFVKTFLVENYVYDEYGDPEEGNNLYDLYTHYTTASKSFRMLPIGKSQFGRILHETFPALRRKENFKQVEVKIKASGNFSSIKNKTRVKFYPKLLKVPHIESDFDEDVTVEEFFDRSDLDLL